MGGWTRRLELCESRLTAPWKSCFRRACPYAGRVAASRLRHRPRRRVPKRADKGFQMAKDKRQMANGRKNNLRFALCHLPFEIVLTPFRKSKRQSRLREVCFIVVLAAYGVAPLQAQSSRSSSVRPTVLRNVGIDQRLNEQIPLDLEFHDETGKATRLENYFGQKPVILSLVYYDCPMLCTMVLNGLLESLKQLKFNVGDQFNVVTVSFDPTEK